MAHAIAAGAILEAVDVGGEPFQRWQPLVAERRAHHLAAAGEVTLDHLLAERLLGGEMVGERALWYAGGPHDVAHAGACETLLMHDAQTLGQDPLAS